MVDLKPDAYTGTPSFLRILLEKAAEDRRPTSLTKASVGGEACPPSLTAWFAERGITSTKPTPPPTWAWWPTRPAAREGLVLDEGVIVEIVRPGTGTPVPDGEVGELVVTTLNPDYPLIRFGTGDLSAMLPGTCPTGRTAPRIKGWMGRADQTTKSRHVRAPLAGGRRASSAFPEVKKARLVVSGEMANDQMCLRSKRPRWATACARSWKTRCAK
jgi:phenylacetate-CoA ligase